MDGHRRYAEDPEPSWYSGQLPYESGVPERPDGAYRLPEQRLSDTGPVTSAPAYPDPYRSAEPYPPLAGYPVTDPLGSSDLTTGLGGDPVPGPPRSALDAIRMPLRASEYPAVRPAGAGGPGDPAGPGGSTGAVPAPASFRAPEQGDARAPEHAATRAPDPVAARAAATAAARAVEPAAGPVSGAAMTPGPAYDDPTGLVPPVGDRSGDGPESSRSAADRFGGSRFGGERVYRTGRPALAVVLAVVTAVLMVPVVRLLLQATFADVAIAAGVVPAVLLALGLPLTGIGLYGVAGAGRALDRGDLLRPPTCYLLVGLVLLLAAGLATA